MRRDERDTREFSAFYTDSFEGARRMAYALCGNWVEAEEIAQASLVKVFTHWSSVRADGEKAYLRTVLARTFLDTKRRRRAREHAVAEVHDQPVLGGFADVDERHQLRSALWRVPPRQRAVLVLRFVQDLTIEQAAETLGCSIGTVKSQTAHGLDKLRVAYREVAVEQARVTARS
ncbi:MAG: SigE family RNA polymerase sigma factor [Sciscionella sp.]|nr:SigE family RNA polymerase sigma factor [Sciscionella sp.]